MSASLDVLATTEAIMRFVMLVVAAFHAAACASAQPRARADDIRRVTVNGTELAYAVNGSGPPLVIIHGAWNDLRSFARAVPILAEGRTVVRISLRLHWPNSWPSTEQAALAAYRVETHAVDVTELIEKLGQGPADVVGHSYGGVVAALVAESRPDLVRRLVLVEPSLYGVLSERPGATKFIEEESRWRDGMLAKIRSGRKPLDILRSMYDGARPGTFDAFPEERRRIVADNARTLEAVLLRSWVDVPYTCDQARRLRMPVLLVEGAKTDRDMSEINSVLLGCLPDVHRVVLPDSGHAIQFEAPEAMARAVREFVGG